MGYSGIGSSIKSRGRHAFALYPSARLWLKTNWKEGSNAHMSRIWDSVSSDRMQIIGNLQKVTQTQDRQDKLLCLKLRYVNFVWT